MHIVASSSSSFRYSFLELETERNEVVTTSAHLYLLLLLLLLLPNGGAKENEHIKNKNKEKGQSHTFGPSLAAMHKVWCVEGIISVPPELGAHQCSWASYLGQTSQIQTLQLQTDLPRQRYVYVS